MGARQLRPALRRAGTAGLAALIVLGAVEPGVGEARHLRPMRALRGYKYRVTPAEEAELRNATLRLLLKWRPEPSDNWSAFSEGCHATKVSIAGSSKTFALTAGHCFNFLTGYEGVFYNPTAPRDRAENYIGVTQGYGFAVGSPESPASIMEGHPVGDADSLIIDTSEVDAALLGLVPADPSEITAQDPRNTTLAAMPALPAAWLRYKALIPGEWVSIASTPGGGGFDDDPPNITVHSVQGNFIGEHVIAVIDPGYHPGVELPEMTRGRFAFVAVNVKDKWSDPCYWGDSGAGAIAARGLLGGNRTRKGAFVGVLSRRFLNGYGPNHAYDEGDAPYRGYEKGLIRNMEQWFGVDLSHYSTICAFAVLPSDFAPVMLAGESTPAVVRNPF